MEWAGCIGRYLLGVASMYAPSETQQHIIVELKTVCVLELFMRRNIDGLPCLLPFFGDQKTGARLSTGCKPREFETLEDWLIG